MATMGRLLDSLVSLDNPLVDKGLNLSKWLMNGSFITNVILPR